MVLVVGDVILVLVLVLGLGLGLVFSGWELEVNSEGGGMVER